MLGSPRAGRGPIPHGLTICTLAASLIAASIGAVHSQGANEDAQALAELQRTWCTALLKADYNRLGDILATDFSGVDSRGARYDKEEIMALIYGGTFSTTSCVDSDIQVRIYGETAIVAGKGARAGMAGGKSFQDDAMVWTRTFVRQNNQWLCVASHETPVASPR